MDFLLEVPAIVFRDLPFFLQLFNLVDEVAAGAKIPLALFVKIAGLGGYYVVMYILFAWAACVCFGVAGMGMSTRQIADNLLIGTQKSYSVSRRLWPKERSDWGIVSMVASFVLLIVGALVSLRKPAHGVVKEVVDPET